MAISVADDSLIFRVNLTVAELILSQKAISSQPDFSRSMLEGYRHVGMVTCHMSLVPWKKNDLSQDHLKAETCAKPMAFWTLTLTSHPQRFQSPVWAFHREWPVTVHLRWIIACWCRLPYQQCKKQHCHSNCINFIKIPAYFGALGWEYVSSQELYTCKSHNLFNLPHDVKLDSKLSNPKGVMGWNS